MPTRSQAMLVKYALYKALDFAVIDSEACELLPDSLTLEVYNETPKPQCWQIMRTVFKMPISGIKN